MLGHEVAKDRQAWNKSELEEIDGSQSTAACMLSTWASPSGDNIEPATRRAPGNPRNWWSRVFSADFRHRRRCLKSCAEAIGHAHGESHKLGRAWSPCLKAWTFRPIDSQSKNKHGSGVLRCHRLDIPAQRSSEKNQACLPCVHRLPEIPF